ncbi:MAG: C40 family peptidase [Candidatus Krumholzibacteriia bacterium]
MRRRREYRRIQARKGLPALVPALLLVCWLLPGCGPKRVVQTRPELPGEEFDLTPTPEPVPNWMEPSASDEGDSGVEDVGAVEPVPGIDPGQVTLGIEAASLAREQLGKQYQWGASGPDRFDCSGLVHFVYGNLGIQLPRTSHQQAGVGDPVPPRELQPGDLLFFALKGSGIDHVGIYLGKQKFIHAPRRHQPVRTDSLNDTWWRRRFKEARRIP